MNSLKRIFIWLKRFPHRKGYGVQSPSDYFLISQIIYEHLPFYSYDMIDQWYKNPVFSNALRPTRRICKLLFRLANYYHPSCILDCGKQLELGCCAMALACPKAEVWSLANNQSEGDLNGMQALLPGNLRMDSFRTLLPKSVGILHIPESSGSVFAVFEKYYPLMEDCGVCIVENIHEDKSRKEEWQALIADSRVRISFDLYELGVILLRPDRIKQDYIVNF